MNCFRNFNRCCSSPIPIRTVTVNTIGPRGPIGPTGATGPTGPTGATRATDATGSAEIGSFASFYSTEEQSVNNTSFPLTNIQQAENITLDTSTGVATLTNIGKYYVSFGVYPSTGATTGDSVHLNLNGTEVAGTARGLSNGQMIDATAIVETTTASSTLNIEIESSEAITFSDTDGISGYLTIIQIG